MALVDGFALSSTGYSGITRHSTMHIHLRLLGICLLGITTLGPLSASAGGLAGVTQVHFEAATFNPSSTDITATNVRAVSTTTTLNDYLIYHFGITLSTQQLTPASVEVFPGIGVFEEADSFFIKNVTRALTLVGPTATQYNSDTTITVPTNATKPYVFANLAAGTNLTFIFFSPSAPYNFNFSSSATLPAPASFVNVTAPPGQWLYYSKIPILKAGRYYLWLTPQAGTNPSNVSLRFSNENGSTLGTLATGQAFSCTFRSYSRDYAKWRISLKQGQDLNIAVTGAPANALNFHLIKADNTEYFKFTHFANGQQLSIVNVPDTAYYYIVIEKDVSASTANFSATVTVSP